MKLSTRTRYGLRAMMELAAHGSKGPLMVRKISERQKISKKYLDIIFTSLKVAGLVKAIRGAMGGFLLARVPEEILISEIVAALEGALAPADCCQSPSICERTDQCATQHLWLRLETAIRETLEGVTLADLVRDQAALDAEPPFCPTRAI